MKTARSRHGNSGTRKFEFRPRSFKQLKERGKFTGSDRDNYIEKGMSFYKPKEKSNCIRILPATWEDYAHFGYDLWFHYKIGSNNNTYLCLEKMKGDYCPICDEMKRARDAGDKDYAYELKPKLRAGYWLIDRYQEDEGVLFWAAPHEKIDLEILKLSVNDRTGEELNVDDPYEEGYDIEFEYVEGKGDQYASYAAVAIARRPSPLGKEEWLLYAVDHPIPDILRYYDADYIKEVFEGKIKKQDSDVEANDVVEDIPIDLSGGGEKEEQKSNNKYTFDVIQKMRLRKVGNIAIKELGFTEDEVDDMSEDELKDEVCKELRLFKEEDEKIEIEKEIPEKDDRVAKLRNKFKKD